MDILDSSDNIHLIFSPTRKLALTALLLLIIAVALITGSMGITMIFTIPMLLFWCVFYYVFCKIWRAYKFSKFYLIAIPVTAVIVSVALKALIYNLTH